MKKLALAIMALSTCSAVQAGTMGAVSTQPTYVPYIVGEASYTGANFGKIDVNGFQYGKSQQRWGGRLGAGIAYPSKFNNVSFTAEIGGGYYGKTKYTGIISGELVQTGTNNIDGYDVLVGALYKTDFYNLDLFGEVGFMVQNVRYSSSTNIGLFPPLDSTFGTNNSNSNTTQALPELKVGAIYNFTPNWGFTVAYMGVYGSKPSVSFRNVATSTTNLINTSTNLQNPTLNSVMFGLRYNIV